MGERDTCAKRHDNPAWERRVQSHVMVGDDDQLVRTIDALRRNKTTKLVTVQSDLYTTGGRILDSRTEVAAH
jgi:hypothetical protein